jgi:hypothetical protein
LQDAAFGQRADESVGDDRHQKPVTVVSWAFSA